MRSFVALLLLDAAALGANAHQHNHRHVHMRPRDVTATVIETVTDYVTEYVNEDGSPVSPSTSSSSSSADLQAIFIQVATTSSSSSIPTTPSTSSTPEVPSTTEVPTPSTTFITSTSETPVTTAAAVVESVGNARVFTIVNSHTAPVSTLHDDTTGTPTSAGQPLVAGTMAVGEMATFVVEPGWVGNIAIIDAQYPISTDGTLIEANFAEWWGTPRADFDVSFVNGFTLPATCSCGGVTTTGCNLDLNAISSCPSGLVDGACANPLRADVFATSTTSFFSLCEGAAWTYVNDGDADSNCPSGSIVCCIGAACPANPKQG